VLPEKLRQASFDLAACAGSVGVMRKDDLHAASGGGCITPLAVPLAIVREPR
jgi:hypothetical protein